MSFRRVGAHGFSDTAIRAPSIPRSRESSAGEIDQWPRIEGQSRRRWTDRRAERSLPQPGSQGEGAVTSKSERVCRHFSALVAGGLVCGQEACHDSRSELQAGRPPARQRRWSSLHQGARRPAARRQPAVNLYPVYGGVQVTSRRRPSSAASRATRSRLRSAHRPETRSSRRLRTARCSASGPTLAHTDTPRRT